MTTFKQGALAAALAASAFGYPASADDRQDRFRTRLSGFNEVHLVTSPAVALRGAISSDASGSFRAQIDEDREIIYYELNYQGIEVVRQAHIHFGQKHTVGGIVVWLCETSLNPAPEAVQPDTPPCPASGTVKGTIEPHQVLTVDGQGIASGEFAELVRAMRAGATYVNVHSTAFPPGEIRGHLDGRGHDHD